MSEGHRIGYGRVSTIGQNLDSQMDDLDNAGCEKIFSDKICGENKSRPGWNEFLEYVRPGDTLVITELSRMSRSLRHMLQIVDELKAKDVTLISLRENIDTTTATGRAFIAFMGAIAQMERELKAERAAAGRAAAKARGRTGGRPSVSSEKIHQATIMYKNSDLSAAEVCRQVGIGKRTLFKYLAQDSVEACS